MYYRARRDALDLLGGLLTTSAAAPAIEAGTSCAAPGPTHQDAVISSNPDVVRLLGDPLRAQIVRILAEGPATTSHLVTDTGAKQPNVSGHLKLLREAGVVTTEPRGRFTYYRLVPDALQGAALHLADLAAQARTHDDIFRTC
nr:metalloregulator ArsR/SmtB family transcription factor [Actinoplanes sp. RD1]